MAHSQILRQFPSSKAEFNYVDVIAELKGSLTAPSVAAIAPQAPAMTGAENVMHEFMQDILKIGAQRAEQLLNVVGACEQAFEGRHRTKNKLSFSEKEALKDLKKQYINLANYCNSLYKALESKDGLNARLETLFVDIHALIFNYTNAGLAFNGLNPRLKAKIDSKAKAKDLVDMNGLSGIGMKPLQDLPKVNLILREFVQQDANLMARMAPYQAFVAEGLSALNTELGRQDTSVQQVAAQRKGIRRLIHRQR